MISGKYPEIPGYYYEESGDIRDENVMRGVHITVFDLNQNIINDEFATTYLNNNYIEEFFTKETKVFWYRKRDQIWPNCL